MTLSRARSGQGGGVADGAQSPVSRERISQDQLHAANLKVTAEIDEFLAELLNRAADRDVMDRILNFRARNR